MAKEEADRIAKEEADRLAKEEADRIAKEEADRLAEEKRVADENTKKLNALALYNLFKDNIDDDTEVTKEKLETALNAIDKLTDAQKAENDGGVNNVIEIIKKEQARRQSLENNKYEALNNEIKQAQNLYDDKKYDALYNNIKAIFKAAIDKAATAVSDAKKEDEVITALTALAGANKDFKEEADRIAKEEADRIAKEEADRLAKEEADRIAKEEADRLAKEEFEKLSVQDKNSIKKIKQELQSLVNKASKLYANKDRPNSLKEDKNKIESIKNLIDNEYSNFNELTSAKKEIQDLITKFDKTLWDIKRSKAIALYAQIDTNKSTQEIITSIKEANVLGDILDKEFDWIDTKTSGTDEDKMISKLDMVLEYGNYSKFSIYEEVEFKEKISVKLSDEASKLYDKAQKESDKRYHLKQLNDANKITNYRIDEKNKNIIQTNLKQKRQDFFDNYINNVVNTKERIKKIINLSLDVFITKNDTDYFQKMLMLNVKDSIDKDNQETNTEIIEALISNRNLIDHPYKNKLISRLSFIDKLPDESLRKLITNSINYNFDNEKLDKWLLEIRHTKKDLSKLIDLDDLKKLITKFDLENKKVGYNSEEPYNSICDLIETLSTYKTFKEYFNTENGKKVLENIKNYNVIQV